MRSAVLTSEILKRKGAPALKPLKPQRVSKFSLEAERPGRRERQPQQTMRLQSSAWERRSRQETVISHFQYWNPELVCGSLWFPCLSWAKAAELSWRLISPRVLPRKHGAMGVHCVRALLMLEAGQPARSVHAHAPTMSYILGPTVVALKTISGLIAHVAMNSC